MTDTLARPTAAPPATDFLPLKGIDHVEFWVGNQCQPDKARREEQFKCAAYLGLWHPPWRDWPP